MKYEVEFSGRMALSIVFGLYWRLWVIGMATFLVLKVTGPIFPEGPLAAMVVQMLYFLIALSIAIWWLFGSGRLGSMRIMFMEQAHYQQLKTELESRRES